MKPPTLRVTPANEMTKISTIGDWTLYEANILTYPWYVILHNCSEKNQYLYHRVYGGICPECRISPPIEVVTAHSLLSMSGKYTDLGPMKPVKVQTLDYPYPQNVPPWYKRK